MSESFYRTSLWQDVLKKMPVPASTYRLQFHRGFTFKDAVNLLPYLRQLGITDLYASPIFMASPGSPHGYDICDHSTVNRELGGEEGLNALVSALKACGMGLLLDFVPNHMATDPGSNAWWRDVLENGPSSPHALNFDIDWDPVKPELRNKILLPILGDQYGKVLERGELKLEYSDGTIQLLYFDHRLPINPRQAVAVLGWNMEVLRQSMGAEDPHLLEFLSIQTALGNLPLYTERSPERIEERRREKEICAGRLIRLTEASPRILRHIQNNLTVFNGEPGNYSSFDLLHELLEAQAYRLAYWKTALSEINYRRFFDVNTLAGLRQEYDPAFIHSHALLFRLIQEGKITGIRLDHIDGLYDPRAYLEKLHAHIAALRSDDPLAASGIPPVHEITRPEFYVIVEKILSLGESLPADWLLHGTSGYDFLNDLNGIFIDARNALSIKKAYAHFVRGLPALPEIIYQSKFAIMVDSMTSELNVLAHALNRISELDRRTRDFTLENLRRAIREIVAALSIYRTYVTPNGWNENDEKVIDSALAKTRSRHPTMEPTILAFLRDSLLPAPKDQPDEHFPQRLEFAMKLQQFTAPVHAKGLEDTAFYRYNLLLSLNEVGGDPQRFGRSLNEFHQGNVRRRENHPLTLLATSTHDTKRGEDARMRLNVLSEMPEQWREKVTHWNAMNKALKSQVSGAWIPDNNEEWLIYQTLLGVWPAGWEKKSLPPQLLPRLRQYVIKAVREAKIHTSWIHNNAPYEEAVLRFLTQILEGSHSKRFLRSFLPFQFRISFFGMLNSLAQTTLKIASPGIPDFYQGTEFWDLNLADPDNRRPVDFASRRTALASLEFLDSCPPEECRQHLAGLLRNWPDGRVKLYVTSKALKLRRSYKELFLLGDYQPIDVEGKWNDFVAGFARSYRDQHVIALVPRRVATLGGSRLSNLRHNSQIWSGGKVILPAELEGCSFRNVFTGGLLSASSIEQNTMNLSEVFRDFPVALLFSETE
jgi:(1->4)-alpha-D-glucan 1-alpha-D-glucosylmutase